MTDLKKIAEILTTKVKIRGKPVAISLFRDSIPGEYEPIETEPCTIIRYAMDEGKKVFFDAEHHDCLVGVYHTGMSPQKNDVVSGEYLSKTSNFFTYEGAARLKSGMRNLPPGMVKAIGAAPLDDVPEGVHVDSIVVVTNPHNLNTIAACRVAQDGILPYGAFGTSLCGELFSTPWHIKNVVVTTGDFGGRMNNRIKQDQLFVVVPIEFADYIPKMLVDMKIDVQANLAATKPPQSKFWKKKEKATQQQYMKQLEGEETPSITFTMEWDEEARDIINKTPEGIKEFAVDNAEEYAREKGYNKVTRKSIAEQMEEQGMNLEDMLGGQ
jgi:uncharacterized protein (DUF169 family)